jgi:hypothetical protein
MYSLSQFPISLTHSLTLPLIILWLILIDTVTALHCTALPFPTSAWQTWQHWLHDKALHGPLSVAPLIPSDQIIPYSTVYITDMSYQVPDCKAGVLLKQSRGSRLIKNWRKRCTHSLIHSFAHSLTYSYTYFFLHSCLQACSIHSLILRLMHQI